MRELHYGGGILVVGRDVCTAVFDYALALARAGKSDLINVPVLVNGSIADSNILLGPTTQIFCTPAAETLDGLDDAGKVVELRERLASLHRPVAPVTHNSESYPDLGMEYE
jgi:hypothetical protein